MLEWVCRKSLQARVVQFGFRAGVGEQTQGAKGLPGHDLGIISALYINYNSTHGRDHDIVQLGSFMQRRTRFAHESEDVV